MNGSLTRVPCTIVTGFLGAGKTTLIRHVIGNAQGRRLAVIVNEFGPLGPCVWPRRPQCAADRAASQLIHLFADVGVARDLASQLIQLTLRIG